MTEIEAKEKWCPLTRVKWARLNEAGKYVTQSNGSFNRARIEFTQQEYPVGLCLASGCMMWRGTGGDNGYCGLAGMPPALPAAAKADVPDSPGQKGET